MAISLPGTDRPLLLNVSLQPAGGTRAALSRCVEFARAADSAAIDSLLVQDSLAAASEAKDTPGGFDSITLLAYLAALTSRIGLVAAVPTAHTHPYNIARRIASLDHIANGRAGALIVPEDTDAQAANYGKAPARAETGARALAQEHVAIMKKLWDSWEDDARVADKASGLYVDLEKVKAIGHSGSHFKVEGPIDIPRPPQGHPLLFQSVSGSAGAGRNPVDVDVRILDESAAGARRSAQNAGGAGKVLVSIPFGNAGADVLLRVLQAWAGGSGTGIDGFDIRLRESDIDAFARDALPLFAARETAYPSATRPDGTTHDTLRGRYGLARPAHPLAAARLAA